MADTSTSSLVTGNETRIAIIGGGKMGEAILSGWISASEGAAGTWSARNFVVVDPGAERRAWLRATYGVDCVEDAAALEAADLILLSVKPQVMIGVLESVAKLPFASCALFVSIAAGLTTSRLEDALPAGIHLVRVMPNIPLLIGAGATTLCAGSHATEDEVALVRDLFGCIGQAFVVEESQMDVTCAINGSGPAYVAALVEALAQAGARNGLSRDLAEKLAAQTVVGTGRLMAEQGRSAEQTRIDVSSPGGTTLAALKAMEEHGFTASLEAGVDAAIRRSKELGA